MRSLSRFYPPVAPGRPTSAYEPTVGELEAVSVVSGVGKIRIVSGTVPTRSESPSASGTGVAHLCVAQERPVLAVEILERRTRRRNGDTGMPARNALVVDEDRRPRIAADNRLTRVNRDALTSPDDPVCRGQVAGTSPLLVARIGDLSREGVAEAVHGANQAVVLAVVADRVAHLGDEARQAFRPRRICPARDSRGWCPWRPPSGAPPAAKPGTDTPSVEGALPDCERTAASCPNRARIPRIERASSPRKNPGNPPRIGNDSVRRPEGS